MAALGRLIPFHIFIQVGNERQTQTDEGVHPTSSLAHIASHEWGGSSILLASQAVVMLDLQEP